MENKMFCLSVPGKPPAAKAVPNPVSAEKIRKSGRPAGSADLCHQRPLRCLHSPPGAGHGDPRGDQPPGPLPTCLPPSPMSISIRPLSGPGSGKPLDVKDLLLPQLKDPSSLPEAALWNGPGSEFLCQSLCGGAFSPQKNEDIRSLRELITYGLKGLAAYTKHANVSSERGSGTGCFSPEGSGGYPGGFSDRGGSDRPGSGNRSMRGQRHGPAGSGQHRSLRES